MMRLSGLRRSWRRKDEFVFNVINVHSNRAFIRNNWNLFKQNLYATEGEPE